MPVEFNFAAPQRQIQYGFGDIAAATRAAAEAQQRAAEQTAASYVSQGEAVANVGKVLGEAFGKKIGQKKLAEAESGILDTIANEKNRQTFSYVPFNDTSLAPFMESQLEEGASQNEAVNATVKKYASDYGLPEAVAFDRLQQMMKPVDIQYLTTEGAASFWQQFAEYRKYGGKAADLSPAILMSGYSGLAVGQRDLEEEKKKILQPFLQPGQAAGILPAARAGEQAAAETFAPELARKGAEQDVLRRGEAETEEDIERRYFGPRTERRGILEGVLESAAAQRRDARLPQDEERARRMARAQAGGAGFGALDVAMGGGADFEREERAAQLADRLGIEAEFEAQKGQQKQAAIDALLNSLGAREGYVTLQPPGAPGPGQGPMTGQGPLRQPAFPSLVRPQPTMGPGLGMDPVTEQLRQAGASLGLPIDRPRGPQDVSRAGLPSGVEASLMALGIPPSGAQQLVSGRLEEAGIARSLEAMTREDRKKFTADLAQALDIDQQTLDRAIAKTAGVGVEVGEVRQIEAQDLDAVGTRTLQKALEEVDLGLADLSAFAVNPDGTIVDKYDRLTAMEKRKVNEYLANTTEWKPRAAAAARASGIQTSERLLRLIEKNR